MRFFILLSLWSLGSFAAIEQIPNAELKAVRKGAVQVGYELKINDGVSILVLRRCDVDRGPLKFIKGSQTASEQIKVELVVHNRRIPAEGVVLGDRDTKPALYSVWFWLGPEAVAAAYRNQGEKILAGTAHAKAPTFLWQTTPRESFGEILFSHSLASLSCGDGAAPNPEPGPADPSKPKSSFDDL